MKACLVFAFFLAAAAAASYEDILIQEWNLFKTQFKKSYDSPVEDLQRMRIFSDNKYDIARHNLRYRAGEESYEMGINMFSDMLPEEVDSIYNGYNKENRDKTPVGQDPELPEEEGEPFNPPANLTAPASINWVEKGAVGPVRNQGKCGSCYAFAALAALEGHQYIKTKKLVNLSPQNIVDCSQRFGNKGCNGGLASYTFNYIQSNNGVNDEASYPYEGKEGKCRFNSAKVAGRCTGFVSTFQGSEDALQSAVALGPVSVSIDSSLKTFQQYKGGVYSDPKCSSTRLGHAVLVVGYGTDSATKKDYWLIKNSWDTAWGEKGYVKLARNAKNMCGVATRPVYPKV